MDMIGQNDECVDVEWKALPGATRSVTERIDIFDQKLAAPIEQGRGEKPAATGNEGATIIRHGAN